MSETLFCPSADGQAFNATAAGTAASFAALEPTNASADVLWLYNPSAELVRVRMGAAATALSFPVPAGDIQPFKIGSFTTIGLWAASTVSVQLYVGDGL